MPFLDSAAASPAAGLPSLAAQSATPRGRPATPALAPWWLGAILLLTMVGFQRVLLTGGAALDVAHAVHGSAALGWSLLLVVQARLAEQRRRDLHRQLAVLGTILAITMVASAPPMLQSLARGATANAGFRPIGHRLLVLDVLTLLMFVGLFALALANVRRPQLHARAIAATGLVALPPGLGRLFMRIFPVTPPVGGYLAAGVAVVLLLALIRADRKAGVSDRVLPAVAIAFVAAVVLTEAVADSAWVAAVVRGG